ARRTPVRLVGFSDAVFAITVTLLVLGIKRPPDYSDLAHGLLALWPSYLNTVLLMIVAFLPFATSVLAGALHNGHRLRVAVVFYGLAFDATALTF
ncbi:MAG TPA: TMEM175 family protein, partial [Streptosporangiaceae bacterium]